MIHSTTNRIFGRLLLAIATGAALTAALPAGAQPANRPLLTNQSGARPNLMVSVDNSGSMAFTYHESYNVSNDLEYQKKYCPNPYSNRNSADLATFNSGVGGEAIYNAGSPATYTCYQRRRVSGVWQALVRTDVAIVYTPDQVVANWSAQRSSDVNPLYYNPRVRYLPRVDGNGALEPANDGGAIWVSNQNSTSFRYTVYQRNVAPSDYQIYHSTYANDGVTRNYQVMGGQRVINTQNPGGFTSRYDLNYTNLRIPQHITYTTASTASPAFTYAYCTDVVSDASNLQTGCNARTQVDVRYGDTVTHTIPTPNTRTECAGSVCTNAQEVANIMNWFRWYVTRQMATSTAIGLALADVNVNTAVAGAPMVIGDKFDDKLRIGYLPINDTTIPNGALGGNTNLAIQNTPGSPASVVTVSRGVRTLVRGSTDNTNLFNWLYSIISRGGTPLHNAVEQAAMYYRMQNGVTENPYRSIPTNAASPEMSCRRSFNLLFSDGSWTGPPYAPAAGPDYDNTNGPFFSHTLPDGSTETFRYMKDGINTVAGRQKYVPFPSAGIGGLADITAHYYWHVDMNTGLSNDIQTRPGQPTFWQNMTTYTVGYLIKPTGEVTGVPTDLSFNQIDQYKTSYIRNGPGGSTVFPTFPLGDLTLAATSSQSKVDDFIEAGYSGGARAFSAKTPDDVKSIFNVILAEILSASGRDAGVSVSSGGGDNTTLAHRLKYTVSYKTMDNSGDILAKELDATGNETGVTAWSAEQLMPSHSARRVFTMHGVNTPVDFNGTYSSLLSDVQTALASGPNAGRIPSGTGFVDYLRGDNNALDSDGRLFRQRVSRIAAMVNPPAVYMGDARDYAYDQDGSGGVDGRGSYIDFTNRKRGYPASLFVATNAGNMHAFSADHGTELAAVMPRRSLRRMLNFAAEPYSFEYVLDGPISENDIFDRSLVTSLSLTSTTEWRAWRHLAVGTGGRGEKTIYAVNSPIKPGAGPASSSDTDYRRQPDRADFLWETGPDIIDAADNADVTTGYMSNPARSGQTEDTVSPTNSQRGRWIVAVNNGHYNGEGGDKSGLVVLDANTGAVIRTIPLPSGYDAGRGLSGVTLLRSYGTNTRVVAAYAGDSNGHLWKFNLSGAPSTWGVAHNQPLFTVPGNRPIYGHPAWQGKTFGSSDDGFIVVFATGMALEEGDLDDQGDQTIYGIWDRQLLDGNMLNGEAFAPVTTAQLEERVVEHASEATRLGKTFYAISGDAIDWSTQRGWFIRLQHVNETDTSRKWGERSVADVQNFGPNVVITTTVLQRASTGQLSEGESCAVSELPGNYVYNVRAADASPATSASFDIDGDGRVDFWGGTGVSGYAVAYINTGGFSRGNSIVKSRATAAGVAIPEEPRTDVGTSTDPQMAESITSRLRGSADEAAGESYLGNRGGVRCQTLAGTVLGTNESSLGTAVYCPTSGWSRTQFQLSSPPRN
ncbi:MAG: hypothetical protein KDF54_04470 [Hydrogenophaga sp.]|nr:hypothetical protein [Hydrogenophaga sp.]